MGDRRPERSRPGSLGVDVNPLMVPGCLGEQVHLLLGDTVPAADADTLIHQIRKVFEGDDPLGDYRHVRSFRCLRRGGIAPPAGHAHPWMRMLCPAHSLSLIHISEPT